MAILFPTASITTTGNDITMSHRVRNAPNTTPAFCAKIDINANLTTANGQPVMWTNKVFDNGNNFTSPNYVVPVDGLYFFYVWLMDDNDGSNTNDYYTIRKNGATGYPNGMRGYSTGNSNHHYQWPTGALFSCSEGDNVQVFIDRMDTGMYADSTVYTCFCGFYVGKN